MQIPPHLIKSAERGYSFFFGPENFSFLTSLPKRFPSFFYLPNFQNTVLGKFLQNILCFFFRLPFFQGSKSEIGLPFFQEFSSQIAKYPMILPRFPKFPSFLASPPNFLLFERSKGQEKNYRSHTLLILLWHCLHKNIET